MKHEVYISFETPLHGKLVSAEIQNSMKLNITDSIITFLYKLYKYQP